MVCAERQKTGARAASFPSSPPSGQRLFENRPSEPNKQASPEILRNAHYSFPLVSQPATPETDKDDPSPHLTFLCLLPLSSMRARGPAETVSGPVFDGALPLSHRVCVGGH
jgi:hypothetical protein